MGNKAHDRRRAVRANKFQHETLSRYWFGRKDLADIIEAMGLTRKEANVQMLKHVAKMR